MMILRRLLVCMCLLLISVAGKAQDISGDWSGNLEVGGMKILVVFHFKKDGKSWTATMDSPNQGATGIPVDELSFEDKKLELKINAAGISYTGEWKDEQHIEGTASQRGMSMELKLEKGVEGSGIANVRPQEPQRPFPYVEKEIVFTNKMANIKLHGTLTKPFNEGKFPAVILISGSGPQDRNSEILGHKSFLVLAHELTKKGFAVLRFDERGVGKSEGNFSDATSLDFASDVNSAFRFLYKRKDIISHQIGLLGHSEGGLIAPMVAKGNKKVGFIILAAAPGISGDKLMLMQQEAIGRKSGTDEKTLLVQRELTEQAFAIVKNGTDASQIKTDLNSYFDKELKSKKYKKLYDGTSKDALKSIYMQQLGSHWMQLFVKLDPANFLSQVSCPVLALGGSLDLQVPMDENLAAIEKALKAGSSTYKVEKLTGLNHLFQEATTGLPSEYGVIEQTFSPQAIEVIGDWIKKTTKK